MKKCFSVFIGTTLVFSLMGQNAFTEQKPFGNVTRSTKSNLVQNVMCMPDTVYHTDPQLAVTTFLTLHKSNFFGIANPSYRLERTTTTPAGTQFRFQQHVNNVPVIGGVLLLLSITKG